MCYVSKFVDVTGEEHLYSVQHSFHGKTIVVTDEKLLYEVSADGSYSLCSDPEVVNKLGPQYWLPPKSREKAQDATEQIDEEKILMEMRQKHHLPPE